MRSEQLIGVKDGLQIEQELQQFDPRFDELSSKSSSLALVSPKGWLLRSASDTAQNVTSYILTTDGYGRSFYQPVTYVGGQTLVKWCDDRECGVFSKAFQLGRVRTATPADLRQPPLDVGDATTWQFDHVYAGYSVQIKPQGNDQTLLLLASPANPLYEVRILIDTAKSVVLRIEYIQDGKITSTTTASDFVEVAGVWWAGRVETINADKKRTSLTTQKFTALEAGSFDRLWKQEMAGRDQVQLVKMPLPKLDDAKRALAADKATFEDHLILMIHFQQSQQWDRVLDHLDKAEKLAAGKPGIRWVKSAVLNQARRHEEVRKRYLDEAAKLASSAGVPPAQPQAGGDVLSLTHHIFSQASSIFEANEMLALLDVLRPVYEHQPAYLHAMKEWNGYRASYLEQTGQQQEALNLRKKLAQEFSHDYSLQQQYVQALISIGEYEAAYAWLKGALSLSSPPSPPTPLPRDRGRGENEAGWLAEEEEALRNQYAEVLRSQGRYSELVDFLAEWVKRNPPNISPYQQYLGALVWCDRATEANRLVADWLKDGQRKDALPPDVASRLQAAVELAYGQGSGLHTDRIDERWVKPLGEAVLFFARYPSQGYLADRIMWQSSFNRTDECRRVRKVAADILVKEIGQLSPAEIDRYVKWISANDPAVEKETWKKIAGVLRKRWDDAVGRLPKSPETLLEGWSLGQTLVTVLNYVDTAETLDFLHTQLAKGPEEYRTLYAGQLFQALLNQPWSAEYENEAFTLLERLPVAQEPAERLSTVVGALYQMTDRMVQARYDARMQAMEHQEKLTRTELRAKQEENMKAARQSSADRLREEMKKHEGALAQWMNAERVYLDVQMGRDLDKAAEECLEALSPLTPNPSPPQRGRGEPDSPLTPNPSPARRGEPHTHLDEVLRQRFLVTLMNLAARKEAKKGLAERVLTYLDHSAAAAPDEPRWKLLEYQLLVALDKPKELEEKLRQWIGAADADNYWRVSLGYLLAEQGKVDEAIKLFEAVRSADELLPAENRVLADWYMVVDKRDLHDRAMIDVFMTAGEGRCLPVAESRTRPVAANRSAAAPRDRQRSVSGPDRANGKSEPAARLCLLCPTVLPGHARLPPAGRGGRCHGWADGG